MQSNEDTDPSGGMNLHDLYSERSAPPELEDRIVAELEEGGWINPRPNRSWAVWPIRAVAGLTLFAAGWGLGVRQSPAASEGNPRFMLLLWEGPDFATEQPTESIADEYRDWAAGFGRRGMYVRGDALGPAQPMIAPGPDGASLRPELTLGGYFILEAESPEAALRIAEAHPHLRHGGWVELAPIVTR